MMRQAEARPAIIAEWRRYAAEESLSRPTTWDAFSFYGHLVNSRPDLLQFRCSGDKWQVIKGWLLREGLVTEPHNRR